MRALSVSRVRGKKNWRYPMGTLGALGVKLYCNTRHWLASGRCRGGVRVGVLQLYS